MRSVTLLTTTLPLPRHPPYHAPPPPTPPSPLLAVATFSNNWKTSVDRWYREIEYCNWDLSREAEAKQKNLQCGHYSQVWRIRAKEVIDTDADVTYCKFDKKHVEEVSNVAFRRSDAYALKRLQMSLFAVLTNLLFSVYRFHYTQVWQKHVI